MDNGSFNSPYNPYGHGAQGAGQQQHQQPPSAQPQQQQQQQQQQTSSQQGLASFGNVSSQAHQQASPTHATLPPLHTQNGGYNQFGSLSYGHPQTPTTPHTPVNVSMTGNANSTAVAPPHTFSGSMLPPTSYVGNYSMPQSMYPSSTGSSMPATSSSVGLPTIRPMPQGGMAGSAAGLPSLTNPSQLQTTFMQNEDAPTHVVGSQGRRGILPSAPGRPSALPQGTGQSAKNMIPVKDADGKFPCPNCSKTYLHAKHLKRHLLRHTGDRPYECHLCKDTFSRSDILKRHFQKCSIRRGNPTGANHLAHQNRRNNNAGNRLSISQQDGPIGLASLPDVAGASVYNGAMVGNGANLNGDPPSRASRANSLISPGTMSHRNSMAGMGILGSNAPNSEQLVTTAPFQPALSSYSMQHNTNGSQMSPNYPFTNAQPLNGSAFNNSASHPQQMSFLGHQSSRFDNSQHSNPHQPIPDGDGSGSNMDWSRMFAQGGQDGFIGSQPANASSHGLVNIKPEPDQKPDFHGPNDFTNSSFLGNLISHPGAYGGEDSNGSISHLSKWGMDDPLQAKVDELIRHCFPEGLQAIQGNPAAELICECLKVDRVKHFIEHYTSFHGHWPILHMPTFKLTEAGNNLVLSMLCIGAVYSPDLNVQHVRLMMEFVKSRMTSSCSIYSRTMNRDTGGLGSNSWEVEELQALSLLQTLFVWHGDPAQREAARNEFPFLVQIARAMGLCRPAQPGSYAYSHLHDNPAAPLVYADVNTWNWQCWLEQEKRNRVLYQLFLTDAAMAIYFNSKIQFDPLEVHLPLPADDAAWDASDARACANALGLGGAIAQGKNFNGTRKPKQMGMRDAMRVFFDPSGQFAPGMTNAYSKFILIHALITRIIACQKSGIQGESQYQNFNYPYGGSTPATPLSQNDWLEQHGSRSNSIGANNSGNGTPTDSYSPTQTSPGQHEKKRIGQAMEKWKRAWDNDMDIQYPPSQPHLRRFGFSRDGVHFFYLGHNFLQTQAASDWAVSGDQRFKRVMTLLKRIRGVVIGDTKGQDLGSVGDIDDQYGLDNLTLDMKLLFTPYNSQFDSPVVGVQTHTL